MNGREVRLSSAALGPELGVVRRVASVDHGIQPQFAWGRGPAAALLSSLLGEPVEVQHLCPACGSDAHGRPWIDLADGSRPPVSIAHTSGLTLVAILLRTNLGVCLGVDVEHADAVPPPGVTLHEWVRAEAFVKATGDGLRRDPASVRRDEPGATWGDIPIDGHVAAWCILEPRA